MEGQGHRAHGRGPVGGVDHELVVAADDLVDAGERAQGLQGAVGELGHLGHDDVGADGALQGFGGALGHQVAPGDDAHPVGQLVGLLQVLGGEEDGGAPLVLQRPDLGPDGGPTLGVEAGGGLVQEEDLGVVDEGGGQVEAALHPSRIGVDLAVDGRADVDQGEDLGHPGQPLVAPESVEPGLEVEELPARLAVVEGRVLEGHADLEADELGLSGHVVAGHEAAAARRPQQGAEHPDQGRLAGPVRAQESVDLAGGDGEVDPVDGEVVAELAGDPLGDDGRAVHGRRRYRSSPTPPDGSDSATRRSRAARTDPGRSYQGR